MGRGDLKCGEVLQSVAQTTAGNASNAGPFLVIPKTGEKRKKSEMSYGSASITVIMVAAVLCVYVVAVKFDLL
jgi:hypothetical protein